MWKIYKAPNEPVYAAESSGWLLCFTTPSAVNALLKRLGEKQYWRASLNGNIEVTAVSGMAASPPPPSLLEWSLVMQIHTLKACQGLKRGLFNLWKAVWALRPLCSGDVENFKVEKKTTSKGKADKEKTRQQQRLATKCPYESDCFTRFTARQAAGFARDATIKREKKWSERVFYGPLPLLTHTHEKIHPCKTIPASAQLNQQRKSFKFPASLWLLSSDSPPVMSQRNWRKTFRWKRHHLGAFFIKAVIDLILRYSRVLIKSGQSEIMDL